MATTIGQRLRQARLDKNISLDELQQITKIQRRYLEAIEQDKLDELPGTFYIRAFVRQYAAAVGEDGDKLVDVLDGKDTIDPQPQPTKRVIPPTVQGSRKAMHKDDTPRSPLMNLLPVIFFGLVALVIVIIVGYMTLQERKAAPMIVENTSVTVESVSGTKASSTASSPEAPSESSSAPAPVPEEKKMQIAMGESTDMITNMNLTDAKGPLKLDFIGTNGRCWIGVTVNGGMIYQYTLAQGETQSFELPAGATAVSIILGASANLDIHANGENLNFHEHDNAAMQKTVNLNIAYQ